MKPGDYVLVLGCDCDKTNCHIRAAAGKVARVRHLVPPIPRTKRREVQVTFNWVLAEYQDMIAYEDSFQVIPPEVARVVYGVEVQDEAG